ncbi:MAG TPA: beta-ketoacyl synthase N-terminal-like domain-containing protein, partial [Acidobacteriota bacterium]|nr:beta-ketoacyl synthase N-terminal-like domain-containing protein [Acidobacteriota bacterium]
EGYRYLDPNSEENDRIYCPRGGFLKELAEFDPVEHGVVPTSVDGTEPDHFLALRAAREALGDAGYLDRRPNPETTEVIVGRGTYVNRGNSTVIQHGIVVDQVLQILRQLHPEHSEEELQQIKRELKASLPPFNAETSPGLVPNIISGRIANRLDFMGPNFIVDAACASSLVAVDIGMRDLLSGRCDLAIAGGVHASTPPPIMMIFCQLKAISRRGEIRPFDALADGTLLGEGVGMVVLKRLEDAERDGDRIYAVLRGIGTASDGKALGLLAPRVEGEELALRRAYEAAGVSPSTIGLIEAHGTGTPVGDAVELESLNRVFGERRTGAPTCALGTVKSMISHLLPASGIAGLIKTALALYHKVLPPTLHCEKPNPKLNLEKSVFYLNTETRPWIHGDPSAPRRAGVNAFGFGGINAHAILEEYRSEDEAQAPTLQKRWDTEAIIVSAVNLEQLIQNLNQVREFISRQPDTPLADLAFTLNGRRGDVTIAFVASSLDNLTDKIDRALEKLKDPSCSRIREIDGIYYFKEPLGHQGKLAFVFPGEGSQYPNMLGDLCRYFPQVRRVFDLMDRAFLDHPRRFLPSQIIFPPPLFDQSGKDSPLHKAIWEMDFGAEAVFVANQALTALMETIGLRPHAMVGHSTGEHSALLAPRTVQPEREEDFIRHVLGVNAVFEDLNSRGQIPQGTLIAAGGGDLKRLYEMVQQSKGKLFVAMDNCPHQVVLCCISNDVEQVVKELEKSRVICQILPFDRAYHTPHFEVFARPLRDYFAKVEIHPPAVDLYSCVTADRFPEDREGIRELCSIQWARPVRFRQTIQKMYDDGIRLFVEVGPKANLTGFINDSLRGKKFAAIPSNVSHHSGVTQLNHLVAQLAAHKVEFDPAPLYLRRNLRKLNMDSLESPPARRSIKLRTNLQPLTLREDFRLRGAGLTASPPRKAVTVKLESPAPGEVVPQGQVERQSAIQSKRMPVMAMAHSQETTSNPSGAGTIRSRVMESHLKVMEEFLQSQSAVMNDYLFRRHALRHTTQQQRASKSIVAAGRSHNRRPLIGQIQEFIPAERVKATRQFDLSEDLLFDDHTLGRSISALAPERNGLPVVPLTISMELLAEVASTLFPGQVLVAMKDVRAYRWISLEEPLPELEIFAEVVSGHPGEVRVFARKVPPSQGTPSPVLLEGTMVFADQYPDPPEPGSFHLRAETSSSWTPERLYREGMFHGPAFQAVKEIVRTGEDGNVALLEVLSRKGLFASNPEPDFLTDAVILDAAGQVVAFWTRDSLVRGFDIFPYRLRRLDLYGPLLPAGSRLECRVRAELRGENQMSSDIDILDQEGRLYYRLTGWEDRRFDLPSNFLQARISPCKGWLSRMLEWPDSMSEKHQGLVLFELEGLTEAFLQAHQGIWLKVLAHLVLSSQELTLWTQLGSSEKRITEWLLGRVVAKDAIRHLLKTRGINLCPADIPILPDSYGKPCVDDKWAMLNGIQPQVSISHSHGRVIAMATLGEIQIGVDTEHIDQSQRNFDRIAFTDSERSLFSKVSEAEKRLWYLRLWSAKESISKALGQGFNNGIRSIEARQVDFNTGAITFTLGQQILEKHPSLRGQELISHTWVDKDYVTAVAMSSEE